MKISIIMEALTGTLETDVKRASKATEAATRKMQADFKRMGVAVGASITAATTAVAAMTKNAIDTADNLRDMSQQFGIAVPVLSSYTLATQSAGTSIEALGRGMKAMAKDALEGNGALKAMGIEVRNADGSVKDMDVLLAEVADKFAGYKDGAEKSALAAKLFGRASIELIPMMNEGAAGLAEMREHADALGVTISEETAKAADEFNDKIVLLKGAASGWANTLAAELLPALNALAKQLIEDSKAARMATGETSLLGDAIKYVVSAGVVAKNTFEALFAVIFAGIDIVGALKDEFGAFVKLVGTTFAAQLQGRSGDLTGALNTLRDGVNTAAEETVAAALRMNGAWESLKGGIEISADDIAQTLVAIWHPVAESIETAGDAADGAAPDFLAMAAAAAANAKAVAELDKRNKAYFKLMADIAKGQAEFVAKQKAAHAQYQQSIDDIRRETQILGLSGDARQAAIVLMQAEQKARQQTWLGVEDATAAYEKELTALADATEAYEDFQNALSILDGAKSPFERMTEEVEELRDALKKLGKEGDKGFNREQFDAINEALRVMNEQIGIDAVGNLQAAADAMAGLFEEGTQGQKRMQQVAAGLSVVQAGLAAIEGVRAILNQGSGDPYSAFARMAAMAAAVAPLIAAIGGAIPMFSGGSGNVSEQNQATQGTGSILGDWDAKSESIANAIEITADATSELVGINRGMLSALLQMQRGISGASASIAGMPQAELSLAEGTNFDPTGSGLSIGAHLFSSMFGGGQELIDQGIQILGGTLGNMMNNIVAGTFQMIETDGGWFHSDDTTTNVTALGEAATAQLRLVLQSIGDAVREGAEALGLDMEAVNAAIDEFRIAEIRISTQGLSGEEAQAELEAVFSSIFDGLAGAVVPFIDQFQQVGEGLGETLIRVATSVQVVEEGIHQLGLRIDDLDPETMAQVSVGIIEAVGSIEQFIAGMQSFVANFAPEAHLFAIAQDEIKRAFEQVGLELPDTRDGLWELMQSLDATTESGQAQIAAILRLAGVADEYYNGLEDQAEDAADAARDAAEALEEQAEAARDAAEASRDLAAMLGELAEGPATEFTQDLAEIRERMAALTVEANDLAIAAGRAGASQEELGQITAWAARQYAMAVDRLKDRVRALTEQLYGTELSRIEAEIESLTTLHNEAQQAADEAAAAQQARYEQELDYIKSIHAFVESLMLSPMSPLNPQAQFLEANAQFQAMLAAAQGGDLDALAGIQAAAQALLEQGQSFLGPSDQYTALFDMVTAALSGLGVTGSPGDGPSVTLVPSEELEALFARREEILLAQEEANRAALAEALATQLGEWSLASQESALLLAEQMGISLADLVTDLGINLADLSSSTGQQLADVASVLNLSVQQLAEAVGASLGELTETNSLLNDAFEAEIADLPEGIQDELTPLLRAVEDAVDDADANAAINALRDAVDVLAPAFRDELAPYLDLPTSVGEPIADMAELLSGLAQEQVTLLDEIRNGINFLAFGTLPPEPEPIGPAVPARAGSFSAAEQTSNAAVVSKLQELIEAVNAGARTQAVAYTTAAAQASRGRGY